MVLLFAVIEFGRLTFTYLSLANDIHEMARQMAIPATTNANVIAAYNNLNALRVPPNPTTDSLTLMVFNAAGLQQGTTQTCTLPVTSGTCMVPVRTSANGGYVQVGVTYVFIFGPQFSAPFGISFVLPNITLSLTTRDYIG